MNLDTLSDLRHDARLDAACDFRDVDAACAALPRAEYNELAVEFLAERGLENAYREWLGDNYPERLA